MHVHVSETEKKRRLIAAIVDALRQKHPQLLEDMAVAIKHMAESEIEPRTGKLKAEVEGRLDHGGYVKIRVPQILFFTIRKFIPQFGDDSKDLRLLADEFPDLCFDRNAPSRKKAPNYMVVKDNYK